VSSFFRTRLEWNRQPGFISISFDISALVDASVGQADVSLIGCFLSNDRLLVKMHRYILTNRHRRICQYSLLVPLAAVMFFNSLHLSICVLLCSLVHRYRQEQGNGGYGMVAGDGKKILKKMNMDNRNTQTYERYHPQG
jgi:hypothetical protein